MLSTERLFGDNAFAGDLALGGSFHRDAAALAFTLPIGLNDGCSAVAFAFLGLDIPLGMYQENISQITRKMCPSLLAHMFSGILMAIALYIVVTCFGSLRKLDTYRTLVLVLLFSIVVGIHGISHLGLKNAYGYSMLL